MNSNVWILIWIHVNFEFIWFFHIGIHMFHEFIDEFWCTMAPDEAATQALSCSEQAWAPRSGSTWAAQALSGCKPDSESAQCLSHGTCPARVSQTEPRPAGPRPGLLLPAPLAKGFQVSFDQSRASGCQSPGLPFAFTGNLKFSWHWAAACAEMHRRLVSVSLVTLLVTVSESLHWPGSSGAEPPSQADLPAIIRLPVRPVLVLWRPTRQLFKSKNVKLRVILS